MEFSIFSTSKWEKFPDNFQEFPRNMRRQNPQNSKEESTNRFWAHSPEDVCFSSLILSALPASSPASSSSSAPSPPRLVLCFLRLPQFSGSLTLGQLLSSLQAQLLLSPFLSLFLFFLQFYCSILFIHFKIFKFNQSKFLFYSNRCSQFWMLKNRNFEFQFALNSPANNTKMKKGKNRRNINWPKNRFLLFSCSKNKTLFLWAENTNENTGKTSKRKDRNWLVF